MSATAEKLELTPATAPQPPPVVIVGTGPAGIRVARELLRRSPDTPMAIFGGEPWEPYNRVRLSSVLSGEMDLAAIGNPLEVPEAAAVVQHHNCPVVSIDRRARTVTDDRGGVHPYQVLVLATGSRPHLPAIPGLDRPGVFTFRDLDDVQRLLARRVRSRRTLVLGGGLLGLEAARGLQSANTEVTVVDHAPSLMVRQLDAEAAERLREHVLGLGIRVLLNDGLQEVLGEDALTGVRLRSGRGLECDTLVVATGIKPTTQLALEAGISVGRGIRVDDQMRTSDPHVYAVGECAEHRGQVYGLAAPGLEQAGVAAHVIAGGEASYQGSLAATRLKVVGLPVFSMGRTGADEPPAQLRARTFEAGEGRIYRKLLLERGRLVGAIAVGEWPDLGRIQEAITRRRRLWPWQLGRFGRTGSPWPESEGREVSQWPASATVCNCTGVTRGRLSEAMSEGESSVAALAACTGASTVCGSCKPLLAELVGSSEPVPAEPGHRGLMVAGVLSLLAALAFLIAPPIPYPDSVQVSLRWDALWRDGLLKQITGFGLLGLGTLISLISLRKRLPRFSLGAFSAWRTVHVVLGVLVAALLVAHTGLRLGHNLNLLLMLSFVGLLLVGAAASGVIGLQHRLPRRFAARSRSISLWLHILLLWPLPALLGFHVLKTYWY